MNRPGYFFGAGITRPFRGINATTSPGAVHCNLCTYCRTHHRLKHQAPGWTRALTPDATLTIATPTGITRSTRPPGPETPLTPHDLLPPAPRPAEPERGHPASATAPDNDLPPF